MQTQPNAYPPISCMVVFGVGLIGGSLTLALKSHAAVTTVMGVGRSLGNLHEAVALGLIDQMGVLDHHSGQDVLSAVQHAEMVVLAMPVGQMATVLQRIAPHLPAHAIVTDVGSTKQNVVALMREYLPKHLAYCVPTHPIAGAELSGACAARVDLYHGRNVVITPLPETHAHAIERVQAMWQLCGAKVSLMTAESHDAVFAAVSHLPHILAYALVDMLAARKNAEQLFDFAASGFRDFTRIAASSPEMWRDIALANHVSLLQEIDAYLHYVTEIRQTLAQQDGEALLGVFERARIARQHWGK